MDPDNQHTSIEFVRSNREVFLGPSGLVDLREFAGQLVTDALCMGSQSVHVDRFVEWYVVCADRDWLSTEPGEDPLMYFVRLKRFPQHRQNTTRATLVVTAFAADVITAQSGQLTVAMGTQAPDIAAEAEQIAAAYRASSRVVAFRGVADTSVAAS